MKRKIKRLALVLLTVLSLVALVGCSSSNNNSGDSADKKLKVGVVQMIENGAFDNMRDGFIQQLRDKGYTEDKLEIVALSAQGDPSTLNTIVQEMADGSYDLVATIATPASQSFVNMKSQTPQVFIAVSDPIKAGVVTSMENPDHNATGTSNPIPVEGIIELSKDLTPGIETFGILYNTSEVNSVSTVNKAKEYMNDQGYKIIEAVVTNSSEVKQAVEGLARDVSAIFVPNDSIIQNAMPTVVETAKAVKIPVYGSSVVMVESGALATLAVSDKEIGATSADMAIEILEGKKPADIPAINVEASDTVINKRTAEAIEIQLSDDITERATILE